MTCPNVVGVKNIMLTFINCDTGQKLGPMPHKQATEELPKWRTYPITKQALPGGYVKYQQSHARAEMVLIRDLRVPLADYQGRSSISFQVEYENGLVYTGKASTPEGEDTSDSHEVTLNLVAPVIDELLPPGSLAAA